MKYISTKKITDYLKDKSYTSISITGSLKGMKTKYGWDKATEIVRSGNYYYCIW